MRVKWHKLYRLLLPKQHAQSPHDKHAGLATFTSFAESLDLAGMWIKMAKHCSAGTL